eukprot:1771531-Pleurochrysis_carterae.AAC.1
MKKRWATTYIKPANIHLVISVEITCRASAALCNSVGPRTPCTPAAAGAPPRRHGWREPAGSSVNVPSVLGYIFHPVCLSEACKHRALPEASKVKAMSPPSRAENGLRAASGTGFSSASVSEAARAARDSAPRRSCFVGALSPLDRRLGQSLCQWVPLHQRQGAHLSLHFSLGSGRGRLGSAFFARSCLPSTAKACAAFGYDSSSRRTLRASASLSTLRAALMVSERLPTPALSESLTSSSVDRLSLKRRTAFATFSDSTESGSCAATGRERFSL